MFEKLIGSIDDKKIYKEHKKKVKELPEEYQYVFKKIEKYLWQYASSDGMDILQIQYDVRELFEQGVTDQKDVLEITGEDVAGFCDGLLENAETYLDKSRNKINDDVREHLK